MKRLLRWLRPRRRNRFPYGIPRVEHGNLVTTYRKDDPFWYPNEHYDDFWAGGPRP